jgi:menaquinone-9 beta-reductase
LTLHPSRDSTQVLIIGGGPAGSAAASVLSEAGITTLLLERQVYPRPKTCGDVLDPVAVHQLDRLGVKVADLEGSLRLEGIRTHHGERVTERMWPVGPSGHEHAYSVRREALDHALITKAIASGAQVLQGHEAVAPLLERGFVRGASVRRPDGQIEEFPSRFTLVADGANSRFGRALGTYRNRDWPYATSIRGYWATSESSRNRALGSASTGRASTVDLYLDLTGVDQRPLLGYGWVVPLTDGAVNIGVTVMSTSQGFRSINTSTLLADLAQRVSAAHHIDPLHPLSPPISGRIPLGGSVGPSGGPTHLVVGDAAGSANPLTGAGVEYAVSTGQIAGHVLARAFESGDVTVLQSYPGLISQRFASTYRFGRMATQISAHPRVLRPVAHHLAGSSRFADRVWDFALNGSSRQW